MREIDGKEMMSPSDIEKELHIKRSTLREYEQKGLIKPSARTQFGSAKKLWYDEAMVFRLREIRMYRELGLPIKEIKILINDPSISRIGLLNDLISKLEARKVEIEKQIEFCKLAKNVGPVMLVLTSSFADSISGYMNQVEPVLKIRKDFEKRLDAGNLPGFDEQIDKLDEVLENVKAIRNLPIESVKTQKCIESVISIHSWIQCQAFNVEVAPSTFLSCFVSANLILKAKPANCRMSFSSDHAIVSFQFIIPRHERILKESRSEKNSADILR